MFLVPILFQVPLKPLFDYPVGQDILLVSPLRLPAHTLQTPSPHEQGSIGLRRQQEKRTGEISEPVESLLCSTGGWWLTPATQALWRLRQVDPWRSLGQPEEPNRKARPMKDPD